MMLRGLNDPVRDLPAVLLERDARHRDLIQAIGAALAAGDSQAALRIIRRFEREIGR